MPTSDPGTTRVFATAAGVRLGALEQISDGKARSFVLEMRDARFHGFVVRQGNSAYGYVDRCPHLGLPLARKLDDYLTPKGDLIACRWHGALFDVMSGRCVGGPCTSTSLENWPVIVRNGELITG